MSVVRHALLLRLVTLISLYHESSNQPFHNITPRSQHINMTTENGRQLRETGRPQVKQHTESWAPCSSAILTYKCYKHWSNYWHRKLNKSTFYLRQQTLSISKFSFPSSVSLREWSQNHLQVLFHSRYQTGFHWLLAPAFFAVHLVPLSALLLRRAVTQGGDCSRYPHSIV